MRVLGLLFASVVQRQPSQLVRCTWKALNYALVAVLAVLWCSSALAQVDQALSNTLFSWDELPDLPAVDPIAGACRGISNSALISAGGVRRSPLGLSTWTDSTYVLVRNAQGALDWQRGSRLHGPVAHAAAISWNHDVFCIGGSSDSGPVSEVVRVSWSGQKLDFSYLPPLPEPASMVSAARVGSTVYVAGGLGLGIDSTGMHNFWSLDLVDSEARWETLHPWPGPPRYAAALSGVDGVLYLFGGMRADTTNHPTAVQYLNDAYRYSPDNGWSRLADLPFAAAAASGISYGPSHILLLGGGQSGRQSTPSAIEAHRTILAYHTITDTWTGIGELPFDHVSESAVNSAEGIFLVGGLASPSGVQRTQYRLTPIPARGRFGTINYLVLAAYCLILVGMGLHFARGRQNDKDYFLARGRIPWWAAGLSIFGTQLSAITFMAIPAKAYATDWVYILGQVTIVLIAPVVIYWYLPFFRRLGVTTAYEYLEKRFNLAVRLFGSFAFILLQLSRMGVVIFLPALALSAVTGLNIYAAILLMGLLSTFYTALGGIEAVIWSDVLQVIVLLGGALLSLVIMAVSVEGGVGGLVSTAASFDKFHTFTWSWDYTTTTVWVVVLGYMFSNLVPYTADQTVVQRYLTTSSERLAARSIMTNAALTIPAGLIFFSLGTALFVFYQNNPQDLQPALQTDAIFPLFIVQQLPAGVSGLLIAGIFAAAMSSLDSSMNSVSAAAVHDFYRRLSANSTARSRLKLAKRLTLGLGILATTIGLLMASIEIESLFDLFLEFLGLFGGSLAGLFALGIFTQRANALGALAGAVTSAVALYIVSTFTQVHFFLYAAIGISTCFIVGYLVSLAFQNGQPNLDGLTIYSSYSRRESK